MKRGAEVLFQVCVGRVVVLRLFPLSRLALREASGGQVICLKAVLKLDSNKSLEAFFLCVCGAFAPHTDLYVL